jgi:hypothetical protein
MQDHYGMGLTVDYILLLYAHSVMKTKVKCVEEDLENIVVKEVI